MTESSMTEYDSHPVRTKFKLMPWWLSASTAPCTLRLAPWSTVTMPGCAFFHALNGETTRHTSSRMASTTKPTNVP